MFKNRKTKSIIENEETNQQKKKKHPASKRSKIGTKSIMPTKKINLFLKTVSTVDYGSTSSRTAVKKANCKHVLTCNLAILEIEILNLKIL